MRDDYFDFNTVLKAQEKLLNGFMHYMNQLFESIKDPYVTRKRKIIIKNYIGCIIGRYHAIKAPKIKKWIYMNIYELPDSEGRKMYNWYRGIHDNPIKNKE